MMAANPYQMRDSCLDSSLTEVARSKPQIFLNAQARIRAMRINGFMGVASHLYRTSQVCFAVALCLGSQAFAALHYVDGSAAGSGTGASWVNAWTTLGAMSGLSAGDTVYISGGSTGNTQTYSCTSVFPATMGSSGTRITYQIGQDSAHNGTAIFTTSGTGVLISGGHDIDLIGDAGDGGKHFKVSGTYWELCDLAGTDTDVRIAYFDLGGAFVGRVGSVNPGTHIEIDHIDGTFAGYTNMDCALYFNVSGSTWDENLVHDCAWNLPWNSTNSNNGSDGVKPSGGSYSIYNMDIRSHDVTTFSTLEHMDGIQALGGGAGYIKAYNNRFTDMTNYGNYWEAINGPFVHLRIFNNIAEVTNPVFGTNSSGGFVVEQKIAGMMDDIVMANNTVVDLQAPGSRSVVMISDGWSTWTNSLMANNLLVDSQNTEVDAGTVTPTNTILISLANAPTYLTGYAQYGGTSNNLRLTALATTATAGGLNVSSYISAIDYAGVAWANPPSVGAYQYVSSAAPAIPTNYRKPRTLAAGF